MHETPVWMHAAAAIPAWMHTDEPAAAMRTDIGTAFSGQKGGLAARHAELRSDQTQPRPAVPTREPAAGCRERRLLVRAPYRPAEHASLQNGAAWPAGRAHELVGLLAEEHPSVLEQARMHLTAKSWSRQIAL